MMGVQPLTELLKVQALCRRLAAPTWVPDPENWSWQRPDGVRQGFDTLWRSEPGMANLWWLAMDLGSPPLTYDASTNPLLMLVTMQSYTARLAGEALLDQAGLLTLQQFHDLLPAEAAGGAMERTYPLLKLLAARRLQHAHP